MKITHPLIIATVKPIVPKDVLENVENIHTRTTHTSHNLNVIYEKPYSIKTYFRRSFCCRRHSILRH